MSLCLECSQEVLDCECAFIDSDCIGVDGDGTEVALTLRVDLDPDPDNRARCGASGLISDLPSTITAPPKCQAYNSGAQSTTSEESLVVALDSERYDSDTMHSTVTNNSRITFKTAGIYVVTFVCAFAGNVTGDRHALIRRNGRRFVAMQQKHALSSAAIECGLSVSYQGAFEVGDFVQAIVKQDSGGALNLLATRYSPNLSVRYRRPLP